MNPISTIKTNPKRIIFGKKIRMSWVDNNTQEVFKSFMPHLKEIPNRKGEDIFAINEWDMDFDFSNYHPTTSFNRWAGVEVMGVENVPFGIEVLEIPEGDFAVFHHKGTLTEYLELYKFIYSDWIRNSGYHIKSSPHLELLSGGFNRNSEISEEEIWVPIQQIGK